MRQKAAGLSGSMRQHIIEMLNECGLPAALHVEDSSRLFDSKRELLHTTSVIKHPVFINRKTILDIGRQSADQLFSAVMR